MQTAVMRCILIFIALLFFTPVILAKDKTSPRVEKINGSQPIRLNLGSDSPRLSVEDTCTVYHGGEITYFIYPWIEGDELFKAYQDPEASCPNPYPFTIYEVIFGVYVLSPAVIQLSVDVEEVDNSDPGCPYPGAMLTMTPLYEASLDTGLYLLAIPLDTPIIVNGPYFVGAYIGPEGTPSYAGVLTDNISAGCVSYNDWGNGYVDLDTVYSGDTLKVFPGRLILLSSGSPGGSSSETHPVPAARFIHPSGGELLSGNIDLWVNDAAGSGIIDRAQFQYNRTGSWIDIGYDFTDDPPLRNGVTGSGSGDGLSFAWDISGLPEDSYQLRAIVSDTLGRADTGTVSVNIDPTPPTPIIVQPYFGQNVCGGSPLQVTCTDEDVMYVSFDLKETPQDFSVAIPVIDQQLGGDVNDLPGDGNSSAGGEFGDYCSGPAAAAMAARYWYNRGYTDILTEGAVVLTDIQLMDRLFTGMQVETNLGTFDGEFVSGLRDYCLIHNDDFNLNIDRSPSASQLRCWVQDYEYAVMIGLSGDPGLWLTINGSSGPANDDDQHTFRAIDPSLPGEIEFLVRDESGTLQANYNSSWVEVDIMLGLIPKNWMVTRAALGFDQNGGDGWGLDWDESTLAEDSLYFIYAGVVDQLGHTGFASALIEYDCQMTFIPGDVNNDGLVNLSDLIYLTSYLYSSGPPPPAGYDVIDINCDSTIDLADVIYFYRFLFLSGPSPCP
ncbi:MAG: hypothetical protein GY841_00930 [FCB group bacterium]|nr:hypothetical protein [FCB group bacterium]